MQCTNRNPRTKCTPCELYQMHNKGLLLLACKDLVKMQRTLPEKKGTQFFGLVKISFYGHENQCAFPYD